MCAYVPLAQKYTAQRGEKTVGVICSLERVVERVEEQVDVPEVMAAAVSLS